MTQLRRLHVKKSAYDTILFNTQNKMEGESVATEKGANSMSRLSVVFIALVTVIGGHLDRRKSTTDRSGSRRTRQDGAGSQGKAVAEKHQEANPRPSLYASQTQRQHHDP